MPFLQVLQSFTKQDDSEDDEGADGDERVVEDAVEGNIEGHGLVEDDVVVVIILQERQLLAGRLRGGDDGAGGHQEQEQQNRGGSHCQ